MITGLTDSEQRFHLQIKRILRREPYPEPHVLKQ
jgi:hypothetical protein